MAIREAPGLHVLAVNPRIQKSDCSLHRRGVAAPPVGHRGFFYRPAASAMDTQGFPAAITERTSENTIHCRSHNRYQSYKIPM